MRGTREGADYVGDFYELAVFSCHSSISAFRFYCVVCCVCARVVFIYVRRDESTQGFFPVLGGMKSSKTKKNMRLGGEWGDLMT